MLEGEADDPNHPGYPDLTRLVVAWGGKSPNYPPGQTQSCIVDQLGRVLTQSRLGRPILAWSTTPEGENALLVPSGGVGFHLLTHGCPQMHCV